MTTTPRSRPRSPGRWTGSAAGTRPGRCRPPARSPRPGNAWAAGCSPSCSSGSGGRSPGRSGCWRHRTAVGTARGSFLRGWRLVAIDGFEVDLPDSAENAAEFGYAGSGDNRSAFPKARVVALAECGTHAFLTAEIDAYKVGEKTLAQRLYPRLRTDRAAGRGPQLLLLPGVGHRGRDRRRPALAGPHPTLVAGGPGAARRHLPVRGHGLERSAAPAARRSWPPRRTVTT